jgi:hypothetical protein
MHSVGWLLEDDQHEATKRMLGKSCPHGQSGASYCPTCRTETLEAIRKERAVAEFDKRLKALEHDIEGYSSLDERVGRIEAFLDGFR